MGLHGLYNALAASIPNLWLATNACSLFKSDPPPSPFESDPTNPFLDRNMCTLESIARSPTCSSENNVLAEEAASHKGMAEYYKETAESYREKQVEHNEKAESLLQLAQSPYPE